MKFEHVLLASDLDGTLLNDERQISKENLQALQYFTKNGGIFVPATGRAKPATSYFMDRLPVGKNDCIILDGAMVYNFSMNKVQSVYPMPEGSEKMLRDVLGRFPHTAAEIYTEEKVYVMQKNDITTHHFGMIKIPYEEVDFDTVPEPSQWFKINFTDDRELIRPVKNYLNERYGKNYSMVSSVDIFYEITHPKANKGEALRFVAAKDSCCDFYAIGDNFNDVSMITAAKLGFAPQNAEEDVKKKADFVVGTNNEHAIRDVICHLDNIYDKSNGIKSIE